VKRIVSYRITITWRNNCATAIVWRDTGAFTRKVGRVTWKCESTDKSVWLAQGRERGAQIVMADQRKRGVRRPIVPPFVG
jgi:hypothetical protein